MNAKPYWFKIKRFMIHIIKHHIKKGSYAPWYDLINFHSDSDVSYFTSDDSNIIERAKYQDKEHVYYLTIKVFFRAPIFNFSIQAWHMNYCMNKGQKFLFVLLALTSLSAST